MVSRKSEQCVPGDSAALLCTRRRGDSFSPRPPSFTDYFFRLGV